ncbi:TIGR03936 family radical SAM-associated protein [Euzebya tangerina]|uniref:TIGR03936 family radical SAM-associated protein n=1 Tax=Euzebya tangerina TaxID=591198 RepID=UPI0013C2ACBF|nr:TIGR03936 family radical SAM-associated protein [Euzebya tangerina]
MRVRVRFSKTGKLRFISAIDLGRVWERALRKANLPVAYSEGFSPHPKVSFGDALPLGFASTAEFAEVTFAIPVDLVDMSTRLTAAFPEGMAVLDAVEVVDGDRRLGKLLQASLWTFTYGAPDGLAEAVAALPPDGPLTTRRERKGEMVTVDVRPALVGVIAAGPTIRAVLHHPGFIPDDDRVEGPAVRADDVPAVLGLPDPPHITTRTAQGRVSEQPRGIADALRETTTPLDEPVSERTINE